MEFNLFEESSWRGLGVSLTAAFGFVAIAILGMFTLATMVMKQLYALKKLKRELENDLSAQKEVIKNLAEVSPGNTTELLKPMTDSEARCE